MDILLVAKKLKEEHNLIVLGAGASIGSDREPFDGFYQEKNKIMPSSDNYFYDVSRRHREDGAKQYLNTLGLTYEGLNSFIAYVYDLRNNRKGYFPDEWRGINLESVFTLFDVGTQMLHGHSKYNKLFESNKECLIDFFVLDFFLRCRNQHCNHLSKVFDKLSDKDNIISFNWDTIADVTLGKCLPSQFNNYIQLMTDSNLNIKKYQNAGNFIKLHGSINWFVCENKKCEKYRQLQIPINENNELDMSIRVPECPCCKKSRKPLIIPPSSNKLLNRNSLIHKLWLLSRDKLLRTKRIIFIGYSFPPNDFVSDWLFRHIYLTEEFHNDFLLPEIIVVNPEIKRPNSLVSKRFKSLFPNVKIKKFATLEEFCETGLHLID